MKPSLAHAIAWPASWLLAVLMGSCGGDDEPPARRWDCFEYGSACGCTALGPNDSVQSSGREVARCESYPCCYVTGSGTDATCDCDQTTACDTEVASRRDAERVDSCPPPAEQEPIRCAAEGENCRMTYLDEQALEGCCSGLLCMPNAEGVPLCQPGTAEQIALARQCDRAAYSGDGDVILVDELQSAGGPLEIDTVYVALGKPFTVGPDSCLLSTEISLGSCDLQLGPERDASGALLVTSDTTSLCEVNGFGEAISGSATFNGVSCSEGRCFAGSFELRLTSTSSMLASNPGPVLTGEPFHLEGTLCPPDLVREPSCDE
jgi:hypothetical protein